MVVVGARVAGASTALLLARAGVRVALVDAAQYGADTVSTHGLMRAGVLQLSRWGLLDRVETAATPPIRRTMFRYPGTEPVRVAIRSSQGVPALYAPRRRLLDRLLVDAAAEAGADVMHRTRVTDLLRESAGRATGVRLLTADGRRDLSAGCVVGADGIGSRVAREVAAPMLRRGVGASAVLYAYFDGVAPDGYEWAYGDGAASGIIPTNDGQSCVFVATTPDRMRVLRRDGDAEQAFAALFEAASHEQADRLAGAERVGRMHGWAGRPAFVRRSWGPGWALVGDAGYYLDPISTHGMTQALRDADLLAGALLEVMSGATSEPVALSRYQNVRDELTVRLLRATDRIATYAWDIGEVQTLLREASAAMTPEVELLESLPAVGTAVAQTAARS